MMEMPCRPLNMVYLVPNTGGKSHELSHPPYPSHPLNPSSSIFNGEINVLTRGKNFTKKILFRGTGRIVTKWTFCDQITSFLVIFGLVFDVSIC